MATLKAAFVVLCLATPAVANDGFGGLSATGLQFAQTDEIALDSEELFIGIDKIKVAYVFRNLTDHDVTGEVIFPLPPISLQGLQESMWNLPEDLSQDNLVNFTATVDGQRVATGIDRIAVIEPPWDERRPAAFQYDTPGRDVTEALADAGLPLTLDPYAMGERLANLDADSRAELVAAGLIEIYPAGDGYDETLVPLWSIVLRYHWTQTFPAGAETRIAHAYDNRPSGGLFSWEDPPADYMQSVADLYCVDAGTSRALAKLTTQKGDDGETFSMGESWNIAYVLRTANSWAGAIRHFKLTIDKGDPGNIVSLCADGIKKTGPTTFVMEKTNFVPDRDLDILVVRRIDI